MLQRLHSLPRETRDILFLLLVVAWVLMPLTVQVPGWCSAMAGALLLVRGRIALRGQAMPSRWQLLALLLIASAATLWTYKTLLGRDAGVAMLVVLLALKTLEMRARRDTFVIFFLGFFALLANFFFSQSLLIAASMLVGLLGLLTALVNSQMPVGRPSLLVAARTAGWMALVGAPIMVVLFVLFPRIAPLWGLPSDAMSGRSGLSGTMQVGTIARLALDDSVAMRIRFETEVPAQADLYFRGPVLSSFDGREWRPLRSAFPARMQPGPDLQTRGQAVRYQVTYAANNRPWLPVLDATVQAPLVAGYTPAMGSDLQWTTDRPMADMVRYSAESYLDFRHGPQRAVVGLQDYVDLPPGFNPRTLQLAVDMRRDPRYQRASNAQLVETVLERLRTGGYTYTLQPGTFGTHSADEFWFDRKLGFCEHIASSFVLLMRALDVPARVVTGYQGAQINPVDGFWTVRNSDAHAWAEVWLAGQGWVRVDPTSAVAPGRTGTFQRLAPPTNVFAQALNAVNPAFSVNLRALWEAANNRWNQWVLNYSQARQLNLLRNLGFESPGWEDMVYIMSALLVAAALAGAAWTQWERLRQDPWLRLLHGAQTRLRKAGWNVDAQMPPRALAQMLVRDAATDLPTQDPRHPAHALHAWLLAMEAWRYAPPATAPAGTQRAALATLRAQVRRMHWPTPSVQPQFPTSP